MLLTWDIRIGKALLDVCLNSQKDESVFVLFRAEKTIRKYLFDKKEIFNIDLSGKTHLF